MHIVGVMLTNTLTNKFRMCWTICSLVLLVMLLLYPERPLSLPECRLTSVPANSGTPYVLFSAKVMLKFSVNFSMTLQIGRASCRERV